MRYTSNFSTVIDKLNVKLKNIANPDPLLQTIAVSLASSNTRRIHNEGDDITGGTITYKISRKTPTRGAYSKSYANTRTKKGRQISKVDFSFTGKLSKEFQASPSTTGWVVGFTTQDASEKGRFLQDGFGKVWGITQQDEAAINRIVIKAINKLLK